MIATKERKNFKTYELLGHFASFSIDDKKELMKLKSPISLKLYMLFQIELAVKHKSIQHYYLENLAQETNSSKKTISRCLEELKNLNLIFFENFGVKGIGLAVKNNETLDLISKLKSEEFVFVLNQNINIIPKIELPSLDTHVQKMDMDVKKLDKFVQKMDTDVPKVDTNVQELDTYVQISTNESRINTKVTNFLKNIYKNNILESNQDHQKEEISQNQVENEQRNFDNDEIKKDLGNIKKQDSQSKVLEVSKLDVIDDDKKNDLKEKEISTAAASISLPVETKIENQDEIKIKPLAERISEELEGMPYNLALSLVKANGHDFVLFTYEKFLGLLEIDESGNSKIKNQVAYFRKMLSNLDSKKDFEENLKSVNFEERKAIEKDEFSRYSELAKYLKLATSINKNLIYDDIAKQILNSCYSAFFDEKDYFKGFGEKRVSYKINTYENQRDFVVRLIKIKSLIGFEDLEKVFNKFMVSSGRQYKNTYAQNKVVSKIKELWERI